MNLRRVRLLMWKELLQLRRDSLLLPLLFIMPMLYLIMFGYVVSSDVRDLPTAIVDQDGSPTSRALIQAFENSGYFVIQERPLSEGAVRPLMDSNQVQVAILIPPGLEAGLERREQVAVAVVVDGADSKTASVASGYAQQILGDFNQSRLESLGFKPETAEIDARVRVLFNPSLRSVNTMIPGLAALILMLSITAIMGQAVVRERERGTLEQMFVTPITRSEYLVGKIAPYVVVASIQVAIAMVVGSYWFGVPFYGNVAVIGAGLFLYLFTCIGQGIFVSMVSRTRHQAQQATMFIMIPTMVLSGYIFPIESMPKAIQPVTYLIPLRYIIVILRSNWIKGAGFAALWPQFAAMGAFSVVVFGLALSRFRKRLAD